MMEDEKIEQVGVNEIETLPTKVLNSLWKIVILIRGQRNGKRGLQ